MRITEALIQAIVASLRVGLSKADAAKSVGVPPKALAAWEAEGARGLEPQATFVDAMSKAESEFKAEMVRAIHEAASGGKWQAAAWVLERKYPDQWGKAKKNQRAKVDMSKFTDDELRQIVAGTLDPRHTVGSNGKGDVN